MFYKMKNYKTRKGRGTRKRTPLKQRRKNKRDKRRARKLLLDEKKIYPFSHV